MSLFVEALAQASGRTVLDTPGGTALSAEDLLGQVHRCSDWLAQSGARCLALELDNGPDWLVVDLACQLARVPMVPIPGFFTRTQVAHLLDTAGVDLVLGRSGALPQAFTTVSAAPGKLAARQRRRQPNRLAADTARVTFTSGTTGTPKGVCLSQASLEQVAGALAAAVGPLKTRRHLCALPLAVLLENVAGVYTTLLLGGRLVLPGLTDVGLHGSSDFAPNRLLDMARSAQAESFILLPQMLKAVVTHLRAGGETLSGVRFVAVGGARTAPALLADARALGLPVFEGYGLSECGSVVCLNTPGRDRPGSVGQVLSHVDLNVADDGEIFVRGPQPLSYAGEPAAADAWIATGDIGHRDNDGFVHLMGRKQSVLVTAYGRNVSPEWVESELLAQPDILQALVLGDDLPGLVALLVTRPGLDTAQLARRVAAANRNLPDYARIQAWRVVPPFSAADGELTANGRPRRAVLARRHQPSLEALARQLENPQPSTEQEQEAHEFLRHPA